MTILFFRCDRFNCRDHVLQLGNLSQIARRWHPIDAGHVEDEVALVRLQAFEKGIELVGHNPAGSNRLEPRQPLSWVLAVAVAAFKDAGVVERRTR